MVEAPAKAFSPLQNISRAWLVPLKRFYFVYIKHHIGRAEIHDQKYSSPPVAAGPIPLYWESRCQWEPLRLYAAATRHPARKDF